MFTGLVEETGTVERFEAGVAAGTYQLEITADAVLSDLNIGDSLAVNGCCLTVTHIQGAHLQFDLLEETVRLTNLSTLKPGSYVNLERPLRADARLGGHFVTGHIDAKGTVAVCEVRGEANDVYLKVSYPPEFKAHLVPKGSIAIDGISLTVAELLDEEDAFAVWLIPHTLEVTNLSKAQPGTIVNLEFDVLAKFTQRMLAVKA